MDAPERSDPIELAHDALTNPETLTLEIVTAVASARDDEPTDLPPLYDSVDVEELAATARRRDESPGSARPLRFEYAGHDVEIRPAGTIRVLSPGSTTAATRVTDGSGPGAWIESTVSAEITR